MRLFRRVLADARLSWRRLRAKPGLALAVVLALSMLIGIWVGIPLYAESATSRLLAEQVDEAADDSVPFGYLFSYNRLSGGNQPWASFEPVSDALSSSETTFGSSVRVIRRVVSSRVFDIALDDPEDDPGGQSVVGRYGFTSLNDLDDALTFVQGGLPQPSLDPNGPIETAVSENLAESLGLRVGERLHLRLSEAPSEGVPSSRIIEVVGIWEVPRQAGQPEDRPLRDGSIQLSFIVPEGTMSSTIDSLAEDVFSAAQWLVLLDARTVTTDNVDVLLDRTDEVNRLVDDRLSGTRLLISPESSLEGFRAEVNRLNSGLASFSLPTLLLVLAVVALFITMSWRGRRAEIEILRSRGTSSSTIVLGAAIEACGLTVVAAALGALVARVIASFIARTDTFLAVGDPVELGLVFNSRTRWALLVAACIAFVVQLSPALTVFGWSRRRARRSAGRRDGRPWWQRFQLDVVLVLGIAFFTWFVLRSDAVSGDLLDDPVVILLPAAITVAAGLVVVRLFGPVMALLASIVERTDSTALLLVARRGARVSSGVAAPILLLVITGALSIYTASLARTMDLQLLDRAHHQVGASNSAEFEGVADRLLPSLDGVRSSSASVDQSSSFARIWGLESATRIARVPGRASGVGGGAPIAIEFTGIDPASFADVAFWRDDYSSVPLRTLLAELQRTPDAVLMHEGIVRSVGLRVGDTLDVQVSTGQRAVDTPMVLVGTFDQFPTWSPGSALSPMVGVLGDFEQRLGESVTELVLFERSARGADDGQTRADFARLGVGTANVSGAADLIARAQDRPERQGVFGLLTVSFVLSTILTVAGLVFYAAFGLTRQLPELGALRAAGLPLRSVMAVVALDLFAVSFAGVGAAVLTGIGMARFVLPRLVGTSQGSAPELLEEVDWMSAVLIPLLMLVTVAAAAAVMLLVMRRVRLFEAVKIGA